MLDGILKAATEVQDAGLTTVTRYNGGRNDSEDA